MTLGNELYMGVIIGLCWSLKSLLASLPANKVQFFACALALYFMLGGLSYGKLKVLVGLATYVFFHHSGRILDNLWEPVAGVVTSTLTVMGATINNGGLNVEQQRMQTTTTTATSSGSAGWQQAFNNRFA